MREFSSRFWNLFRRHRQTKPSQRFRSYRPILESLEARCLPSTSYVQTNLVSDTPGMAQFTDPNLVNPWGIAYSPTTPGNPGGPFWISDNNAGVSTIYNGDGSTALPAVTIPPPAGSAAGALGTPTGVVFNNTSGFVVSQNGTSGASTFIFATEDGTIAGWNQSVNASSAITVVDNSKNPTAADGAVYKGLAMAGNFIYAADFRHGTIDVFDQNFKPVTLTGNFTDPKIPAGFAPFDIQNIGGKLYVTYAEQDAAKHDDVGGAGNGFVDVFGTDGVLQSHLIEHGALNSPWGVALAPAGFGQFSGDLLVGNFKDGHINAFDPTTGVQVGALFTQQGDPSKIVTIDHLWGLKFGNGGMAGATTTLFFTAGIGNEQHGLFGSIQVSQPTPATSASGTAPGVISGLVYLNPTDTGVFQTGDTRVPGATVNLVGTTTQGTAVNSTTTTDANGSFTFFQVQAGTYSLTANTGSFVGGKASIGNLGGQGGNTVSLISVSEGQAGINYNLAVRGFSAQFVSLRQFLSTSTHTLNSSVFPAAGSGIASVDNTVQPSGAPTAGTASLAGSVQDASSAGIKGVQIDLTGIDDTGRDILQTATTGSNGAYSFSALQSGTYTLNVNAQPAGFRAGSPTVGSLGGLVFQNDQIIKIPVATGGSGIGYNFQEISVPAGSGTGPTISAALADDTAGPGGTASDGITSDPSVLGKIANTSAITAFSVGFDSTPSGSFTSVLSNLASDGTFLLNRALLGHVAGGTLADGTHTLHLLATNALGQSSSSDVTFTLNSTPPTVPTVHLDSTSDPGQTGRTTASTVTIQGQTTAGVQVELIQGTATKTTTANASGAYSFGNITLSAGSNKFTVQARDIAGNTSQHIAFFVLQSAPVAVPTAPVSESLGQKGPDRFVDLSSPTIFTDPNASNTLVRVNTTVGPMDVQLFDAAAPQTVANFLSYIQGGQYTNDVFHRLDTNPPVLQGGGFTFNTTTNTVDTLTPGPNVPNEFSQTNSNVAGTIAMAKQGGNQNSASSQFFFNLGDNSVTLNAANNGGFTVFGKVFSGQDQRILNTLAAFPVKDETPFNGAFNVFPLQNYSGTNFPHDATLNNFAAITGATVLQQSDQLTYSIVSNTPSGIVTATIVQGQLKLHPTGTGTGTATVVVKATNKGGQTASVTFSVKVGAIGLANPGNQTDLEGDSVTLANTATNTGTGALTFSATGLPGGLSIDPTTGTISGTIASGANTSSPFTTTVTVSAGTNTASQTFNWTVFPGVTITAVPNQTNKEGDTVSLPVSAKAANNNPLTFSASNLPTGLSIDGATGLITGTISAGAALTSPFPTTITAAEGTLSNSTTFTWTVNPVVTIASINPQTNLEGDKPSLQVTATDADNTPLTFSATTLPTGLTINSSTGLISGTIAAGAPAASPFQATITATDGTFSASRIVTWNVNPVVEVSPIANRTNAEGDTVSLQVSATDAKSQTLSFSATHLPTGLSINATTGLISGPISLGAASGSPYATQVTASDGTFSDTQMFTWTVNA
jgi:uncharacterized protein (TIGR03118 family)